MGIKRKIYFFGQTPIAGVDHIPLQTSRYINPQCDLSKYDFLILTSKRAIQALQSFGYDFGKIQLYCVGFKTAGYAREAGLNVVYTAQGYAKDLISKIKPKIAGMKGLYLRPKTVANSYITNEVEKGNLDQAICYETVCVDKIKEAIEHPAIFLFAAPSQINCFMKHFTFDKEDSAVVIGRTTQKALPKDVDAYLSDDLTLDSLYQKAEEIS